jgi:hypothetical protein
VLELAAELEQRLAPSRDRLETRVASALEDLADELGVPSSPTVGVRAAASERVVRILVDGRISPYPLSLSRRTWLSVAPPAIAGLAFAEMRDPAGWLRTLAADPESVDPLIDHLAALTRETVALHPSRLLPAMAAQGCLDPSGDAGVSGDEAIALLHPLLELGCSLRDREALRDLILSCRSAGMATEDIVEVAFARRRSAELEVLVHPDFIGGAARADTVPIEDRALPHDLQLFGRALRRYLNDLGVSRSIVVTRRDSLDQDQVCVRINDRTGPAIPLARHGEVVVQESPPTLQNLGFEGRPLLDAASGHRIVAFPDAEEPRLREAGLTPLTAGGFMAVTVAREVAPLAYRLLDVHDVERDLAALMATHEPLVGTALMRFSTARITRICRGLLCEQVSSRDLWAILNSLLRFAAVGLPRQGCRLIDDRVPVPEPDLPLDAMPDEALVSFVRLNMSQRLAYDAGLRGEELARATLPVVDTHDDVETVLRRQGADGDGHAKDAIRYAVNLVLADSGAPADAIILVPAAIRVTMREVLADEFPTVRVLATNEVPPHTRIETHARIALT